LNEKGPRKGEDREQGEGKHLKKGIWGKVVLKKGVGGSKNRRELGRTFEKKRLLSRKSSCRGGGEKSSFKKKMGHPGKGNGRQMFLYREKKNPREREKNFIIGKSGGKKSHNCFTGKTTNRRRERKARGGYA